MTCKAICFQNRRRTKAPPDSDNVCEHSGLIYEMYDFSVNQKLAYFLGGTHIIYNQLW